MIPRRARADVAACGRQRRPRFAADRVAKVSNHILDGQKDIVGEMAHEGVEAGEAFDAPS